MGRLLVAFVCGVFLNTYKEEAGSVFGKMVKGVSNYLSGEEDE